MNMPHDSSMDSISTALLHRLFGLHGRVAVVVGGAGRIGRPLCRALWEAGASVAVLDVDESAARATLAELAPAEGRRAAAISANVADAADLDRACERISRELGPPDILVNAAQYRGGGFYSSRVEDYPIEAWQKVIEVNLTGVHLACQTFGRSMIARGGGSIINLASTYGLVSPDPRIYGESGVNSPVAYAAAKAGVINLTRYLAVHWRDQNIRVNCLVPGGVFDRQGDEFVAQYSQRTPLGRMASADEYQGAVLFMASSSASYMTGAVLAVDGGWTAW
jgi:NAD(P)-dependent dehydrogenase (short-subunit alcohol dehydrogenase family)